MKTRKRYFLTINALILTVVMLAGLALTGAGTTVMAAPGDEPAARVPGPVMPALPEAACTLAGSTRTCHLWALTGAVNMPDGRIVPIWGFASTSTGPALVPGPVIRANPGETLEIVLHNTITDQMVSLDFPGQETGLVPDITGVPAGSSAPYVFPVAHAGTFLYEAGLTPGGARQVTMGLFGPLIVSSPTPAWNRELLVVFSEIDHTFNASPATYSMLQYKPKYWLINGLAWPNTGWMQVADGETVLIRYLNAGVEHRSIGLLGLNQKVLSMDGEPLPFPQGAVAVGVPAGQTADALVTIPTSPAYRTAYAMYSADLRQHNNNQRLAAPDGRAAFGGMMTFLQSESTDVIFRDGFESGNLSAWSRIYGSLAKQSVTAEAALAGSFGLAELIDTTQSRFVEDSTPVAEAKYHARFYFDPNSIAMANGDAHPIFTARTASAEAFRIEFYRSAGVYKVRARIRNDGGVYLNTALFTLSDAPHTLEVAWSAATGAGANNGSATFYVDGVYSHTISGIDNDAQRIEVARLGPWAAIDATTRGTEYFDDFISTRSTYIGP